MSYKVLDDEGQDRVQQQSLLARAWFLTGEPRRCANGSAIQTELTTFEDENGQVRLNEELPGYRSFPANRECPTNRRHVKGCINFCKDFVLDEQYEKND